MQLIDSAMSGRSKTSVISKNLKFNDNNMRMFTSFINLLASE
jgi:hypothetical protein